jgi:hypothetical protein
VSANSVTWEEFKKRRESEKGQGKGSQFVALNAEELGKMRKGDKVNTTFGRAPAQLICVETFEEPTLFRRFLVMVYGCEVAEVCAEKDQQGKWTLEEL